MLTRSDAGRAADDYRLQLSAGPGEGLDSPWSTAAPPTAYLRRARASGIDRTVIFSAQHTDYARGNANVARIAERLPGRFFCFAVVHARHDAGRIRALVEQAVQRWHFRGIKVHRYESPATREVAEVARDLGLPVLYDVLGQPWRIEPIAAQYPQVDFIIPHLGSFADHWRVHAAVID